MKKNIFLKGLLILAGLSVGHWMAQAADYPRKPITFMVAYKAGGSSDVMARQIAAAIEQSKGWKIIVRNTTGAAGGVMLSKLKRAKPDGYTLGLATAPGIYLNPVLNPKSGYGVEDFSYISSPVRIQVSMVALADHGWKNLSDMAAYAKKHGGLNFAYQGPENLRNAKKIATQYGVDFRYVPIKGESEGVAQVMGKHADAVISAGAHVKYVEAGKMTELALLTSERSLYSPDVATATEQGIKNIPNNYFTLAMPKNTPTTIVKQWSDAVKEAMQSEPVKTLAQRMRLDIANPIDGQQTEDFLIENNRQAKKEGVKVE